MSEQKRRPEDGQREFADAAWSVPSYLLSGMIIWGGLGWLLAEWTGQNWLTAVGVVIGVGLAVYLVYVKYGRHSL
ncbi:AtpZ/AtpI family protein [Actinomadura sp. KC06]|uniref:AtpZ/AtpI family protein n=1 Tax=Actinomadura sp. KC06 TaxID=2530369 RepID=UPI00104F1ABD|nr:AtpZ/AtpI family protein [Actinomadura sp. KC06]TDD36846.1 AtpZ/AtpI family protein [Actinomadura sp. KC06]